MTKTYQIIYADPPWTFETYSEKGKGRSAEKHYPCMSIEAICELPVPSITAIDCALFMWTTSPHLERSFEVIRKWGFKYKTMAFVWVKGHLTEASPGEMIEELYTVPPSVNIHYVKWHWGTGYWTRANAEYCLLATKGHPKRVSASVQQVVFEQVGEHSKKPDEVRNRIVELMGDIPRIELFARSKAEGWDSWGNEVESDIKLGD